MIFFPSKLISGFLWNQHYLTFFVEGLVLFGSLVGLVGFGVFFFLDLCSLFLGF